MLTVWLPASLPLFIGGWVAAKLAAGWQKYKGEQYAIPSLIGLLGNAWSLGLGIAIGIAANPSAIAKLEASMK